MKKASVLFLLLAVILTLCSCSDGYSSVDTEGLSAALASADIFEDELYLLSDSNASNNTGIDLASYCEKIEFYQGSGATGEEYGIFTCNSTADAKELYKSLGTHKTELYDIYSTYNTDALPRIENATIVQAGKYVVFVSARDFETVDSLVKEYLVK